MRSFMFSIWDDLDTSRSYVNEYSFTNRDATIIIIGLVVAILASVILYFTFLSRRNEHRFKGFTGWLYETLNFRKLIIEALLKITYMFFAIYVTVITIVLMTKDFLAGLLCLVVCNVIIRISYEILLIIVMTCKNVSEINRKMKDQNNSNGAINGGNTNNMPPQQPYGQQYTQPMMNQQPMQNQYQNQGMPRPQAPYMNQNQGMNRNVQGNPMQPQGMNQQPNMSQSQNNQQNNMTQTMNTPQSQGTQQNMQQTANQPSQQTVMSNTEPVITATTEETPLPKIQNIRSCPKCGTMLESDDAFCPSCGTDVRNL